MTGTRAITNTVVKYWQGHSLLLNTWNEGFWNSEIYRDICYVSPLSGSENNCQHSTRNQKGGGQGVCCLQTAIKKLISNSLRVILKGYYSSAKQRSSWSVSQIDSCNLGPGYCASVAVCHFYNQWLSLLFQNYGFMAFSLCFADLLPQHDRVLDLWHWPQGLWVLGCTRESMYQNLGDSSYN